MICAVIATAAATHAPIAAADPATDTSCTPALAGVMSKKPTADVDMLCKDAMWYPQPADGPPSDRWVTFGPTLTLRGDALPNPNVLMGSWTAKPLGPWTRCRAVQQTGVGPGAISPPLIDQSPPNSPMAFDMEYHVVTARFSGYCLWERQP
jgi:hypothetical protein